MTTRRSRGAEELLHRACVQLLGVLRPRCLWFHIPNGAGRSKAEADVLKAMGVRAGAPDLAFILPGGGAAFIEIKAPTGRLSPEQRAFRDDVEALGARYEVVRDVDGFLAVLRGWGVVRPGRGARAVA